jgi:hypothetical protein
LITRHPKPVEGHPKTAQGDPELEGHPELVEGCGGRPFDKLGVKYAGGMVVA